MGKFRTLDDVDFARKRVLIRLDLNVPLQNGRVSDTTRIDRVIPTLQELRGKGASIRILSHFGRPNGKVVPEMSLRPIVESLQQALGAPVRFIATDWQGEGALSTLADMNPGEVLLLENTRFSSGEVVNDAVLAKTMASLGDIYVNDAFSAAHRAHASTVGVAALLPGFAGRAMEAELNALEAALTKPNHPVLAIVGGAKVSSKLDLLGNLSAKVDGLIIGGGMANTFLAANGISVGKSLCEVDLLETALEIQATAQKNGCEIILPLDALVAGELKSDAVSRVASLDEIGADDMILDVGPQTIADLNARLENAATLVWNGPLGAFEIPPFDTGTVAVARHAAELTGVGKLVSVAGGGDTVAALGHADVAGDFSYVSTAGGAFLEWLEGKVLPGVKVLERRAI